MNNLILKKRNNKEYSIELKNGKLLSNKTFGQRDAIIFTCTNCGKMGSRRVSLWRNLENLKEEDFICQQCSRNKNNLEKYGVENPMQREEIVDKLKKDHIKKYGVENPMQREEVKEKTKATNIKKYGGNAPICDQNIFNKIKQTTLNKYGVENILQIYQKKDNVLRKQDSYKRLNSFKNKIIVESFEEYKGQQETYHFKCLKCNTVFTGYAEHILLTKNLRCPKCEPFIRSKKERDFSDILKSYNMDYIQNDRKTIYPFELDFRINDIAIEFNGLFWHNEKNGKDKNYHLNKTNLCNDKNIKLFQFFEDELEYKFDIIKSMILGNLNIYQTKVGARKTKIKNVSIEEKRRFLNDNHLQGTDNANINIGLFYKNEIISLMTFYKENKKNNVWVLSRFASKKKYQVMGAASKILKYFIKEYNPSSIVSFSDKRISIGNLYKHLGFKYVKTNPPAYWYVKGIERIHRFNFRKERIKKIFPNVYNENKTEKEMMIEAGYDKIWDCGNDKWELILDNNF